MAGGAGRARLPGGPGMGLLPCCAACLHWHLLEGLHLDALVLNRFVLQVAHQSTRGRPVHLSVLCPLPRVHAAPASCCKLVWTWRR